MLLLLLLLLRVCVCVSVSCPISRLHSRRTGVVIAPVAKDTAGLEGVDDFWGADSAGQEGGPSEGPPPTPARAAAAAPRSGSKAAASAAPANNNAAGSSSAAASRALPSSAASIGSPALSSPGFDFGNLSSAQATPAGGAGGLPPLGGDGAAGAGGGGRYGGGRQSVGALSAVPTPPESDNGNNRRGDEDDEFAQGGGAGDDYDDQDQDNDERDKRNGAKAKARRGKGGRGQKRRLGGLSADSQDEEEEDDESGGGSNVPVRLTAEEARVVSQHTRREANQAAAKLEKKRLAEARKRDAERRRAEKGPVYEERDDDDDEGDDEFYQASQERRAVPTLKFIPVTDEKEGGGGGDDDDEDEDEALVRRSRRQRFQPLKYWKNEKLIFQPKKDVTPSDIMRERESGAAMLSVPTVSGVLQALPSPPRKRRTAAHPNKGKVMAKRPSSKLFDTATLNSKYKYLDGENAEVWDEKEGEYKGVKVISYGSNMAATQLPVTSEREAGHDVVGLAAQAFNIQQATDTVPGWISGHVILPPRGIKDAEGVGMCSQVFFVSSAQSKALEVAIGAPQDTVFNDDTAQRFLLSAGDFFHVPPNNIYRLENHSGEDECKLFWTILRPMMSE